MEASSLLNLDVISRKPYRWFGLVTAIYVKENRFELFVLNAGSRFTPASYFLPESIVRVEEESIQIKGEKTLIRENREAFVEKVDQSLDLFGLVVEDCYGMQFGTVKDAFFDERLMISDYIVSRSFFDDVDYGYVILPAEDMQSEPENGLIRYKRGRDEIPEDSRQSGLMRKIFGIREKDRKGGRKI